MSNSSPFLQDITEKMKKNGANEAEINDVSTALETDLELQKNTCNDTEGYVWNSETNTCDQKIDLEPIEDVVVNPLDETATETATETTTENTTQTETETESVFTGDGWSENTTSTSVNLINKKAGQTTITQSKKEQEKTAAMFPKEDLFYMSEADFGWGDESYTEEAMVDMMLRKYGGLGLEIKIGGVGTSKFIIGGKEVSLGDAWTDLWNPDLKMTNKQNK